MYAIIQTGGKQFRVEKGIKLNVARLSEAQGGDIEISDVLLIGGENGSPARIGRPFVKGSKVIVTVLKHFRGEKLIVFKKRSKKGYKKIQGHRQDLTQIEIKEVIPPPA